MIKCNFYCRCPFKHKVSLDRHFIGRRIPILVLGKYKGFILFPITEDNGPEHYLYEPQIEGIKSKEKCGECSVLYLETGVQILYPRFNSICFLLDFDDIKDNKITLQVFAELERLTSKFIKCISLIKPNAIIWSLAREEEYVEAIDEAYLRKTVDKNVWTPLIFLDPYGLINREELTINEFWGIFRKLSKDISLQYELLADTIQCKIRYEYREAVLNCATIIEKTLKDQIRLYLNLQKTADNITEFILKSADGFDKILKAMKKFGLSVDNCNDIKDRTIFIRNRVIHGGYFPTKEEVERAIEDARLILKQYNVPLFID